jgi:hypothetical protein
MFRLGVFQFAFSVCRLRDHYSSSYRKKFLNLSCLAVYVGCVVKVYRQCKPRHIYGLICSLLNEICQ